MKPFLIAALLCSSLPLAAQGPATQSHTSELGFSYVLPSDWQVMDAPISMSQAKQQAGQSATSEDEKKGVACVQLVSSARHGTSGSVIVEMALPFACFGSTMTASDLPGFATGASEGLRQNFDLGEPIRGEYQLGTHSFWIESLKGTPKGRPEAAYTVEITCGLLKEAAVCWMALASNEADLATFEHGAVVLDNEPAVALVPSTAFLKKKSS